MSDARATLIEHVTLAIEQANRVPKLEAELAVAKKDARLAYERGYSTATTDAKNDERETLLLQESAEFDEETRKEIAERSQEIQDYWQKRLAKNKDSSDG